MNKIDQTKNPRILTSICEWQKEIKDIWGEIQGLAFAWRNHWKFFPGTRPSIMLLCELSLWFLVASKDYLILPAQLLERPFDTLKDLPPLRVDIIRGRGEYP